MSEDGKMITCSKHPEEDVGAVCELCVAAEARAEVINALLLGDWAPSWDALSPEQHETVNAVVADLKAQFLAGRGKP